MRPETPIEIQKAIQEASLDIPASKLAEELGVHRNTVLKYRQQSREDRQEATKEILVEYARKHTTNALERVSEVGELAMERYRVSLKPDDGRLALEAAKAEIALSTGETKVTAYAELTDEQLHARIRELAPHLLAE